MSNLEKLDSWMNDDKLIIDLFIINGQLYREVMKSDGSTYYDPSIDNEISGN